MVCIVCGRASNGDLSGNPQGMIMRDVWNHQDVHIACGVLTFSLSTHDSVLAVLDNVTDTRWWSVYALRTRPSSYCSGR
jgi:hypothetical protein